MTDKDRKEFILLQSDVMYTKEKVKDVHKKVENLSDQFKKLSFHLIGDADTETKGWIWKLNRFDGRLSLVEKTIAIGSGLASALVIYLAIAKDLF